MFRKTLTASLRRVVRLTMFMVAAALVAVDTPAQDTPDSALKVARKQEKQAVGTKGSARDKHLRRAVDMYRSVIERWPKAEEQKSEAYLRMGELQKKLGETTEAMTNVDLALATPGRPNTLARAGLFRAKLLVARKQYDEATASLRVVVEKFAKQEGHAAEALLKMTSIALRRKNWSEADAAAQKLLDVYPTRWRDNVDAANYLVRSLVNRRRWVDAIAKLEEIDTFLRTRFADHPKRTSVEKAMAKMSARKTLTPVE